jgi:AcrR family transcriptional regulator
MKRNPPAAKLAMDPDDYEIDIDDGNKYKKGIETRDQIFSEAIDLFYEKGFADTSIRQIINKVGKSSSVIYNHFADKEDILFIITRRTGEKTLGMLAKIRQRNSDPETCLKAMVTAMVHLVSHPSMVKEIAIFRNEAHHLPTRKRKIINRQHLAIVHEFEEVLAQIAKKRGRRTVNSKVAAFSVLAIINWFYMWYHKDGKMSLDAVCSEILQFIFHGLD